MKRLILPHQRIQALLCAACLALGLTGCGEPQDAVDQDDGQAIVLEDNRGEKITLDQPPQRIAAMTSFAVEILMAMDKTPVARFPDPDLYPPGAEAIPEVTKLGRGTTHRLDIEQLIAADPDLIILHTVYGGVADNVQQAVGVPVMVLNITSIDELRDKAAVFAQLAGDPSAAKEVFSDLDKTLAWLGDNVPEDRPRTVSLLGMGGGEYFCHRGNHFMGSLLDAAGADNIAAGREAHSKYKSLSPIDLEKLIAEDPEVIFLIAYGDSDAGQVIADFRSDPAIQSLKAVRDGRVHTLPDTIYTSQPGPRAGEALRTLFGHLYPDAEAPNR
ncbi:MAG: ABC transporter substrate-binding protein [Phycisphaeraceae bacterium]|nr:ABC transporter substrate-binding protein [Phycisphaeraceae bacterium]